MPNYWDSLKDAVATAIGKGLSTPFKAATGLGGGMTQARVAQAGAPEPVAAGLGSVVRGKQAEAEKMAKAAGKKAVDIAAKPSEAVRADVFFNLGVEQVDKFYQWAYPKVAQPISTAFLASADNVAGEGLNLVENWKLAREVSPAQAFAGYGQAVLERTGVTPFLEEQGAPLPLFLDPNFNIADPDERKAAFEKDIFGRAFTGGLDALLNWYADPGVIIGKAIAFGKIANLDRPIESAKDVIRLRSELDTHGVWLKSGGTIGRETPMGVVAQRLTGKNAEEIYDDVFVRRTTNPTLVAGIGGDIDNYDDMADFLAAAAGDKASLLKLEKTRASIADDIRRNQELLDPIEKKYNEIPWGQATNIEQLQPTVQEYDRLSKVLEDLRRRDTNLDRAISENISDFRVITDYSSAADVQLFNKNIGVAVEKARAKASEAYHNVSFYTETFRKTPFSRAVTVISLPFNKLPRGIVRVDGGPVADSFSEIKYALNSVKPLRSIEYAAVKNDLARSYLNARNAKERGIAVENIESEIADIIALEKGMSLEEARDVYRNFVQVRKGIMNNIQKNAFDVDNNGDLVTSAFWKTEMPNIIPMMNFKDFEKALDFYRAFGEKGLMTRRAGQEVISAADFLNQLFKVSVLTRLGYPMRNTIDGQLRAFLTLKGMAKTDDYFKNFVSNTKTRAILAKNFTQETVQLKNPYQLRQQTGKLIATRNNFVDVRNSILDELTPQAYYAGASGVFGKQVDPAMVELAVSSKTKPLLKGPKREAYFELLDKKKKQGGLLFGQEKERYQKLEQEAFGKYIREEVVPGLPKDVTLVYADYPSGKIFYKIPGTKGRIPKGAYPEMQPRKGIPASMLEMEIQAGKTPKLRAKEPSARPDIRVVTSYDISRKQNFEDIAEIIGEDQMRRVRTYSDKINKLNDEIDAKIVESQELALIRSELKIKRAGETDVELISPRGKLVNAEGAFAGPNGFLTRQDSSSARSLNWLTEQQSYLAFDAEKGARSPLFKGKLSENRDFVKPTDPQYFNELANFANNRLRKDQLAMRILEGQGDSEIAGWLRTKGKFYLREIDADIKPDEIMDHIAQARARVYRIFPDQQMRSLIAREELSPEQFDVLMRGMPNLPTIAGRQIMEDGFLYGSGAIRRGFDKFTNKLFEIIGTTPEDNLVAWPFYNKLYLRALQREVNLAEDLGKNILDEELIIQMQRSAHAQALKTTNQTLYRVTNNTGMSNTLRFLIPFFNAQYNAVKVYGKLLFQDPSRIARASQIWNLPNRVATVVDDEGNQVPPGAPPSTPQFILLTIPENLQGKFGIPKGYQVSIPKNSLNVFLQGENPLAPAFGVPVTIATSSFANSRPEVVEDARKWLVRAVGEEGANTVMSSLLPFGRPAEKPWDLLLPAAARKIAANQAELGNEAFGRAVVSAYKTLVYQWDQDGRVGKQPTFKDAMRLAKDIYDIRIATNLVLPFTFSFRPEWQIIVDDYRRALTDPIVGRERVDDYILGKYGDIGYLMTAPTSKNATGVLQTPNAVRNTKEFSGLMGKMDELNTPGLIGFLANFGVTADKYSDAAANYFRNKDVRPGGEYKFTETRAANEVLKDREISLGWISYTKEMQKRDAALAREGINSIDSKRAQQLGYTAKWEAYVSGLKEYYPAWGQEKEFGDTDFNKTKRYIKGLTTIVQDKKWMAKYGGSTTMDAISDYITNRQWLAQQLDKREKIFGSRSIKNEYNADLKNRWDEYVLKMKLYSSGFADIYSRYLENDNYEVIG
jgi:hypothetical protein